MILALKSEKVEIFTIDASTEASCACNSQYIETGGIQGIFAPQKTTNNSPSRFILNFSDGLKRLTDCKL